MSAGVVTVRQAASHDRVNQLNSVNWDVAMDD